MNRDIGLYIQHILDNMQAAERFVTGLSLEEVVADDRTVYAGVRAFEIIGEAAKQEPST